MRDIFKKLRCRGSNEAAANASDESKEPLENPKNGTSDENKEKEGLLNGDDSAEDNNEDGGAIEKSKAEEETKEEETHVNGHNEECPEQQKNGGEITTEEEAVNGKEESAEGEEEDRSLINKDENEEEKANENGENNEGKETKKNEKKAKKKEGSKWMCGLGKKSGSKEKKSNKQNGKKSNPADEENMIKDGDEEENLVSKEEEGSASPGKASSNDEANEAENENGEIETKETAEEQQNGEEKVIVFVSESETVVHEKEVETKECTVSGDGIVKATKDKPASFEIRTTENSNFECKVSDADGNEIAVEMERVDESVQKATYWPKSAGLYIVEAMFEGSHVIGSPFQVQVAEEETE